MKSSCCKDCCVETMPGTKHDAHEYYMLKDTVWADAIRAQPKLRDRGGVMLCIGCVEKRLGRQLIVDDFSEAPLNYMNAFSPLSSVRLLSRMGVDRTALSG